MNKNAPGRFFEDFRVGQMLRHATPRTVTEADQALYIALTGSRFALHSSDVFARGLGLPRAPLDDLLVFNLVFGRSVADISLNAVANLGYAACVFGVPVYPGDTLTAHSRVLGLRETASGKTGVVWVRTTGTNQRGETVLDYIRWVMVNKRDPAAQGQDVIVEMDPVDGEVTVRTVRHVVEEVEDPLMELTAEQAQDLQAGAVVGDMIETGQLEYNPGRIAAQTAKQVVMQRLREAERDIVFEEFIDKEGEVLTATVQRVESRWVTVDLGRAEAVMPPTEQSPFERYRPEQQLKFYVVQVGRTIRGPEIIVSRTHPDLLRRLFEVEVPEIFSGVIEIKAIAREPGARSKVAVASNQDGVDAVGACVGLR